MHAFFFVIWRPRFRIKPSLPWFTLLSLISIIYIVSDIVSPTLKAKHSDPDYNLECNQNQPQGTTRKMSSDSKYLCGTCKVEVSWSHKGVACDNCNIWYHAHCQGIGNTTYQELGENEDISWACAKCGCLNRSIVSFDLYGVSKEHSQFQLNFKSREGSTQLSLQGQSKSQSQFSIESMSPTDKYPKKFKPAHTSSPKKHLKDPNLNHDRPLRIINVNFHSVVNKFPEVMNLIDSVRPDIIIGTETWLEGDIADNEVIPSSYRVHRKDRNREGGGVLIAVHKSLQSSEIPELDTDCEIKWVKIIAKDTSHLYVCACYRNKTADKIGLQNFENSVRRAASYGNKMIIAGDLNLPHWDYNTMTLKKRKYVHLHEQFMDLLNDLSLEQIVKEKTHEHNTLDVIITNNPSMVPRVEVIPGISDHEIAFCEYRVKTKTSKTSNRQIPLYGKANWQYLKLDMEKTYREMEQDANLTQTTAQMMYDKFETDLKSSIEKNIPHKTINDGRSKSLPWVTNDIKKLIRRRDRLYRRMKKTGQQDLRSEISELKRQIQKEIRRSYWDYLNNIFTDNNDHPQKKNVNKKFWQHAKNKRNSQIGVPPLKNNGALVTDPTEKANLLNEQFNSAFSEGKQYSDEEIRTRIDNPPVNYPSIPEFTITIEGVYKILSRMEPSKAAGPDQVSPRILKQLASEIAPILTLIYKKSLSTANVPWQWKVANVTPIFKKGEHYLPVNYRPVSLTSVPCKILEHILVSNIMTHWEENNILAPEQHGFRTGRSTESQLINLSEVVISNLDDNIRTDVVVLDFAKAFDKVNHSLLLYKIERYGVRGCVLNWIASFLSGRTQTVVVDGCHSTPVGVRSGVPQGSVLGPCLFLGYINDLPTKISSRTRLFADDTALDREIISKESEEGLQNDLYALEKWETQWDMKFHPNKCCVLSASRKRRKETPCYRLHNQILDCVDSTKYLGVTIQNDGKWDNHIQSVVKKGNKMLGFVRRNVKVASTNIKEQAYKALVRPSLEYAACVWDPHQKTQIENIEKIQRRAARYVLSDYRQLSSVSAMIQHLNWQSLETRRKEQRLSMMYKILNGIIHVDKDHLVPAPERSRRCHPMQMKRIAANSEYRLQSFFPRTIRDWNDLLEEAVTSESLNSFRGRLRATTH